MAKPESSLDSPFHISRLLRPRFRSLRRANVFARAREFAVLKHSQTGFEIELKSHEEGHDVEPIANSTAYQLKSNSKTKLNLGLISMSKKMKIRCRWVLIRRLKTLEV